MAATFLRQSEQRTVLRRKLLQRVTERIEFLRIDRAWRLGDVFVLLSKRRKDSSQLLPTQVIDARIAGQPKEPRFELRGFVQPPEGADHFDEHQLCQVLDRVAPTRDRVNKSRDSPLVTDNKRPLGGFFAPLSPADKFAECVRCRLFLRGAFVCFA